MRGFTSRFALGALLLGSVCALADTAQAGPFRNRRAVGAYSSGGACCDGGYTTGVMPMPSATTTVGVTQPMYYPSTASSYDSTAYYPAPRRGFRAARLAPRATYGYSQPMYAAPTGVYQAGYTTGYTPGIIPTGGVPLTMPTPVPTRPGDATAVEATAVKITDGSFAPDDLNLKVGSTVKWTNDGKKPHTVTSDKNDWGSNELAPGQTFTATFTKAGTFEYHCKLHPDMKAKITVK